MFSFFFFQATQDIHLHFEPLILSTVVYGQIDAEQHMSYAVNTRMHMSIINTSVVALNCSHKIPFAVQCEFNYL